MASKKKLADQPNPKDYIGNPLGYFNDKARYGKEKAKYGKEKAQDDAEEEWSPPAPVTAFNLMEKARQYKPNVKNWKVKKKIK